MSIKKIAFLVALIISCNALLCQPKEQAKKGVLDLRHWNWNSDGIAGLNGEWEFYWNNLYTPASLKLSANKTALYSNVPGFWNSTVPGTGFFEPVFGYATYRLKVLCPASDPVLNLKILTIASSYKLFVNGKQVAQIGKVGTSKSTTIPAYTPVIIPVTAENDELDLLIQVANFNYSTGGLWDFIKLGKPEQIQSRWIKNVALAFFIAGSFSLIGMFYCVVYVFYRKRIATLYFGIFCILLAVRPLITDELPVNLVAGLNWQLIKHLEFISFYLAVPVLSLFSYELFPNEFSKKVLRYIIVASTPFILAAIFTSPFLFRYTLRPFQILMLLTAGYGLFVYAKAARNKRPGSAVFFVGFVILFCTIVNDLLYTSLLIKTIHLIYAGLFIFIVSQAVALSKQFFFTFERLEVVNKELEIINVQLNEKNNIINEANNKLTKVNAELDILVFRTSHDLRSPITSIVALVHIIEAEQDAATRSVYLNMQLNTLRRLNLMITDILDFSKNKSSELQYEPVDFRELIHQVLQDHILSDNSSGINRIVEADQPVLFVTDKARLNMAISNLISNALRYHNKQQADPYVKITVNATETQASVQVIDNGQGIDEMHIKHIFTMFYRANKVTGGSGLGLYIVKEAVEKLGGTIQVESELNAGTRFILVIPNRR